MGNWCCVSLGYREEYRGFMKRRGSKRSTLGNNILGNDEELLNDPEINSILQNEDDVGEILTDDEIEDYIKNINPI